MSPILAALALKSVTPAERTARALAAAFEAHYGYAPTIHDPRTTDWYDDGKTWVVTADEAWTFDTWTVGILGHAPSTWSDAYDSGAMLIGNETS